MGGRLLIFRVLILASFQRGRKAQKGQETSNGGRGKPPQEKIGKSGGKATVFKIQTALPREEGSRIIKSGV